MSKRLSSLQKGAIARVVGAEGDTRFLSRITSIGLTPGSTLRVLKNDSKRPLLVYSRDTMIALNKDECDNIIVETEVPA
ncbi:MAG: ferrous iron transport protein A [Lachnospiraceae bacterium]|nr:ferrous iron transport protein A [Lachnospiraceae bacterium]